MRLTMLMVSATVLAAAACANPIEWPVADGGDGHYYEVVQAAAPLTWAEADAWAQSMSYEGMSGHLATIATLLDCQTGECQTFLSGLAPCEFYPYNGCASVFLGGWSAVTEVFDPRPYFGPFVRTAPCQWITGEIGAGGSPGGWTWPVGQLLHLTVGLYDTDGMGLPNYGPTYQGDPDYRASAFMVEYDGLVPFNYPHAIVQTSEVSWGHIKAQYR
ncbi:MAG: hypothetical protein IPK64_11480 [bacterium]|nr:hypothetical protein [bacterium]